MSDHFHYQKDCPHCLAYQKKGTSVISQPKGPSRPDWNAYFMDIAHVVASRATCDRAHVGAVFVRNRTILSTGYNGSIRGAQHCDDAGHLMHEGHCIRTVHAEANGIAQAALNGIQLQNSDLYCTHLPCFPCFKLCINAGVQRIYFREAYRKDEHTLSHAKELGIWLEQA